MKLVSIVGFFNSFTVLILVITGLLKVRPQFMARKTARIKKIITTAHSHAGRTILVTGPLHGYLALGGFGVHPGFGLYGLIVLNVAFIMLFKKTKKKVFFNLHKYFPLIIVIMLALHFLSMNDII